MVLLVLLLMSFKGGDNSQLLYANFKAAVRNKESIQKYLVVRVIDRNKNTVREFCTLGCFFRHALHMEWKIDYDRLGDELVIAKACINDPRLFEFKDSSAIQYLGMDLYSEQDLAELDKQVGFKKLAKEILLAKKWEKTFGEDDKLMRIYAHGLFNQGILTGEDITAEGGKLQYLP